MRMKTLLLAGVAALAASAAHAADLPPIIEPPVVEPFPKESHGGWYLRGDIGYTVFGDVDAVVVGPAHQEFYDEDLENTWVVGGGIGYKWSEWFRTDLTVDYRRTADFKGKTPCGACAYIDNESDLETWLFLANAYVDLGHWYGFSPYVGGGIGFAHHSLGRLNGVSSTGVAQIPLGEDSNTSFAAAGMAGVSYHFSHNLALDANYRFVWLGDAEGGSDGFGNSYKLEDITAHDFRVGMRYTFN